MPKYKVGKRTEVTVDGSPRDRELREARAKRYAPKSPAQQSNDSKGDNKE